MLGKLLTHPRVSVRVPGPPDPDGTCVVYWMQRAQRGVDNPALDVAIEAANALSLPVAVFLGLHPFVVRGNLRHYHFLVQGFADIARQVRRRRAGFILRRYPDHHLAAFAAEVRAALVIGDENPLRQLEGWRRRVAETMRVPFWTVDADVVVPSRLVGREHYAARTIRPRLTEHLDECLAPSREPVARVAWRRPACRTLDPRDDLLEGLPVDRGVAPVGAFRGGPAEAERRLRRFVRTRLAAYATGRSQPALAATSELSPYLHFGHIGPRRVAHAVRASGLPAAVVAPFLEQLIVRRELAVNFVTFNRRYDRLSGCEPWARRSLERHQRDPRPHRYTEAQLEAAATHDPLWNAAQVQMMTTGWMHGYVRMYWAKKILEWSGSAEEAFAVAVRLNDRYLLDGRDPNGYANIAWAIGGKHDRPWPERPIFGLVRAMTFDGTVRKSRAWPYIAAFGGHGGPPGTGIGRGTIRPLGRPGGPRRTG